MKNTVPKTYMFLNIGGICCIKLFIFKLKIKKMYGNED
jgi:hypothetical protein